MAEFICGCWLCLGSDSDKVIRKFLDFWLIYDLNFYNVSFKFFKTFFSTSLTIKFFFKSENLKNKNFRKIKDFFYIFKDSERKICFELFLNTPEPLQPLSEFFETLEKFLNFLFGTSESLWPIPWLFENWKKIFLMDSDFFWIFRSFWTLLTIFRISFNFQIFANTELL